MRTTLIINDQLMNKIKSLAAKQRQTISKIVEGLLLRGLSETKKTSPSKFNLPHYSAGVSKVDLSDRDALMAALDEKQ